MANFIKKIFEKNIDKTVHNEFIKFGKGEFKEKYLIQAKKLSDKFQIKTSSEFSNYLVKKCLETAPEKIKVKGILISTFDLSKDIPFQFEIKKYMGIQKTIINTEIEKQSILNLMEKYPKIFYGLSFKTSDTELKIKEKAPKSGKPSSKNKDSIKADFCNLKTTNQQIFSDLLFDINQDFKEISIFHNIIIDKTLYPDNIKELMKTLSPKQIREKSKRKGKIIRHIDIDGQKQEKQAEFTA